MAMDNKKELSFFFLKQACFLRLFLCLLCISSGFGVISASVHVPTVEKKNSPFKKQIKTDLSHFLVKSISERQIIETMNELQSKGGNWIARFKITDEGATLVSAPDFQGICGVKRDSLISMMLHGFQNLVVFCHKKNLRVPEVDFIVWLGDWYISDQFLPAPFFVYAKDDLRGKGEVLIPDFEILSGYEKLEKETLQASVCYPWNKKIEKAIWRGSTTGSQHLGLYTPSNFRDFPRIRLVEASLENPRLIDARLTNLCQGAEGFAPLLEKYIGKSMPIQEHIQFKYQILVDGNTCTFSRAYWQMLSNCVIFKQKSTHVQWYYKGLLPYVHYVPVKENSSDLTRKINWAKKHDKKMLRISKNATAFVQENLSKDEVNKYLYCLFTEYEKLLVK